MGKVVANQYIAQYKAYCSSSGGGPGWGGFLKIHSAFSKLWASTPAGFCVAADNWACVQCDDVYMYFEPQLYKIPSTCYTPIEFGAVATLFNDVARNGKSDCTIGVKDGLWGYGLVSQNFEVQDRGCLKRC
jgi:hypothetical protein